MNDSNIPDELPDDFFSQHSQEGFEGGRLRDKAYSVTGTAKEKMREEVEKVVNFLKEKVIPKVR
jgi:hypothetical protein